MFWFYVISLTNVSILGLLHRLWCTWYHKYKPNAPFTKTIPWHSEVGGHLWLGKHSSQRKYIHFSKRRHFHRNGGRQNLVRKNFKNRYNGEHEQSDIFKWYAIKWITFSSSHNGCLQKSKAIVELIKKGSTNCCINNELIRLGYAVPKIERANA